MRLLLLHFYTKQNGSKRGKALLQDLFTGARYSVRLIFSRSEFNTFVESDHWSDQKTVGIHSFPV